MAEIFPQGRELIEIIERHDWLLYDVTLANKENRAFTWEELLDQSPASQIEMGNNYIFVPQPMKNQTLREAYSITKGLGPSLTIEDSGDPRWRALEVSPNKLPGWVALFSRLFFEDHVIASSPNTAYNPEPDIVAMPYSSVVETFEKYFRIVQPEEVGAKILPIPMPNIPKPD